MRHNRLFPGIILVFIGLAFLLNSLGVLHFHWQNFIHLWPLFIVIAGINLLLGSSNARWALPVRLIVVVGCLALLFFGNFGNRYSYRLFNSDSRHHSTNGDQDDDNDDDDDDVPALGSSSTYTEPWSGSTKVAVLNISGGGTHYKLNDTTNMLMTAHTNEYNGHYTLEHHTNADSSAVLNFAMNGHKHNISFSGKSNIVDFKLNNAPLWDMNVKGGADELDFDLTKFKVRNLTLNGGATDFKVKMGMPVAETRVNISTGVSDITIDVPSGAACDVTTSTGLSSSDINGFNKIGDNHYQTSNFNTAANKMYIHFKGGVSDFKVNRY